VESSLAIDYLLDNGKRFLLNSPFFLGSAILVYLLLSDTGQQTASVERFSWTLVSTVAFQLFVSVKCYKSNILNLANGLFFGPIVVSIVFSSELAMWTGQIRGIGVGYFLDDLLGIPKTSFPILAHFFLTDYWLAAIFSQGVSLAIVLLSPFAYYLIVRGYVLASRFWHYLLEEPVEEVVSIWPDRPPPEETPSKPLLHAIVTFSVSRLVKFMILNSIVSLLLMLVLSFSGIDIIATTRFGGRDLLLPAYVGYVSLAQLFVATLLLSFEVGKAKVYRRYISTFLGFLTLGTFLSFLRSPLLSSQFLDLIAVLPVLYLRNTFLTPLVLLLLLPYMAIAIDIIRQKKMVQSVLFAGLFVLLYWPFFMFAGGTQIQGGTVEAIYLVFLNGIYPVVSIVLLMVIATYFLFSRGLLRNPIKTVLAFGVLMILTHAVVPSFTNPFELGVGVQTATRLLRGYDLWVLGCLMGVAWPFLLRRSTITAGILLAGAYVLLNIYLLPWAFMFLFLSGIILNSETANPTEYSSKKV